MISIDLGSYETKIVEGKVFRDNIKITRALSFDTPLNSYKNGYIKNEAGLKEKILEEIKKNKLKGDCYLNIKSTAIITREIIFPVLGDKEIAGLLRYQLPEYLPMDPDKYIVQHKPIEKVNIDGSDKLNTLIVAVPKEMADAHFSLIKDLGLRPMVMDYQCNALWKLLKHSKRINDNHSVAEKTAAIIDLGYDSTSIIIIKNGTMQFCRVLDDGGESIDDNLTNLMSLEKNQLLAGKSEIADINTISDGSYSDYNRIVNIIRTGLENLMERIDRVFRFYTAKEIGNEIDNIFLYGGLSNIKGIDKLFSDNFHIPAVIIKNLDRLTMPDGLDKYINCIGTLLRDDEVTIK